MKSASKLGIISRLRQVLGQTEISTYHNRISDKEIMTLTYILTNKASKTVKVTLTVQLILDKEALES